MILHEKDSAVNGKSNRKVYFLRTAVVTSLYAGGAFSSPTTYSLDRGESVARPSIACALHRPRRACRIESGVPHGCAHGAMVDVSRHTALVKGDDLWRCASASHTGDAKYQTKLKQSKQEKKEGQLLEAEYLRRQPPTSRHIPLLWT